jgi:tetratricopeptide (TPR) repeat protein
LKLSRFAEARGDCQAALRIDEKFSKAYNRLSKCNIALGELAEASINLQKSIAIEPNNAVNKKDQKALNDLKITESLIYKALDNQQYEKAVTNLTELLKECRCSILFICLKIECLLKAFMFDEANKYSADIMK